MDADSRAPAITLPQLDLGPSKGEPSCPAFAGAPDINARQQLGRLPVRRPHSLTRIPPTLADGATRAAAT